eukprot:903703-Amphidinium_carterae.1
MAGPLLVVIALSCHGGAFSSSDASWCRCAPAVVCSARVGLFMGSYACLSFGHGGAFDFLSCLHGGLECSVAGHGGAGSRWCCAWRALVKEGCNLGCRAGTPPYIPLQAKVRLRKKVNICIAVVTFFLRRLLCPR